MIGFAKIVENEYSFSFRRKSCLDLDISQSLISFLSCCEFIGLLILRDGFERGIFEVTLEPKEEYDLLMLLVEG